MLPALLTVLSIALGFALDCLLGDPAWLPHPVRWIGRLICGLERLLRRVFPASPGGERAAGILLVLLTAGISTAVPAGILWGCWLLHPIAFTAVQTLFCYQILAVKSLKTESMKVAKALQAGDLPGARQAVSRIVGRDTDSLDTQQVAKAAVETVAENTTDGVVAPLFFLALGGAPLGFLYKAVNTMDSMVGYRNDTYRYFGTAAAKPMTYATGSRPGFRPCACCSRPGYSAGTPKMPGGSTGGTGATTPVPTVRRPNRCVQAHCISNSQGMPIMEASSAVNLLSAIPANP